MKGRIQNIRLIACFRRTFINQFLNTSRDFAAVGINFIKKKCARAHPVNVKIAAIFEGEVGNNQRNRDGDHQKRDQRDELIIASRK